MEEPQRVTIEEEWVMRYMRVRYASVEDLRLWATRIGWSIRQCDYYNDFFSRNAQESCKTATLCKMMSIKVQE